MIFWHLSNSRCWPSRMRGTFARWHSSCIFILESSFMLISRTVDSHVSLIAARSVWWSASSFWSSAMWSSLLLPSDRTWVSLTSRLWSAWETLRTSIFRWWASTSWVLSAVCAWLVWFSCSEYTVRGSLPGIDDALKSKLKPAIELSTYLQVELLLPIWAKIRERSLWDQIDGALRGKRCCWCKGRRDWCDRLGLLWHFSAHLGRGQGRPIGGQVGGASKRQNVLMVWRKAGLVWLTGETWWSKKRKK